MKRLIIISILSIISLGGFAMGEGEMDEVFVPEACQSEFQSSWKKEKVYIDADDLKDAINSTRLWEAVNLTVGTGLVVAGAGIITCSIIEACQPTNWPEMAAAGAVICITGGTLIGAASIPFFVKAHKLHKKRKQLKLQLEPMMSRDLMGTVNVSPGVGFKVNF